MGCDTASHSLELPLELCAEVIDCLEDPRTLSACALVHRSWRYYSQSNLFKKLEIDLTRESDRNYVERLKDGSSAYCLYLRALTLWSPEDVHTMESTEIGRLVRNLPHLRSLEVVGGNLHGGPDNPVHYLPSLSLDSLVLDLSFFDPECVAGLLVQFSYIKYVTIKVIDPEYRRLQHVDLPVLHHLRVMSLAVTTTKEIMLALRTLFQTSLPTLNSLEILPYGPSHDFRLFVNDTLPQLESLTLTITLIRELQKFFAVLDFSQCRALRSLTLTVNGDILDPDLADIDRVSCSIIPRLPSTTQILTFEMGKSYYYPRAKSQISWEKMEDIVLKNSNLSRVTFKVPIHEDATFTDWQETITELLPRLHEKRIIQIYPSDKERM